MFSRLALIVLVLVTLGVVTGAVWGATSGLPDHGSGQALFVEPVTTMTSDGASETNLPRIGDVPPRPGIRFAAGVGYAEAVATYYEARYAGRELPAKAELVGNLPAGKVVRIAADGRITLDPAAPFGYDPSTGVIQTPGYSMPGDLSAAALGARIRQARRAGLAIPSGGTVINEPLPRCEVDSGGFPSNDDPCPPRAPRPDELVQLN